MDILKFILIVAECLLGAGAIWCAIQDFKRQRYFAFGWMIMMTIWAVLTMADMIFTV